jgi:pyrimidine deaminase RibD-like protein
MYPFTDVSQVVDKERKIAHGESATLHRLSGEEQDHIVVLIFEPLERQGAAISCCYRIAYLSGINGCAMSSALRLIVLYLCESQGVE